RRMQRIVSAITVAIALLLASPLARAQPPSSDDCAEADCRIDLAVDECADPAAGCRPEQDLDDTALEQWELTDPPPPLAVDDAPALSAAGNYLDVLAGDRAGGHGVTLALAGEDAPAIAPAAQFSLARLHAGGARAIRRAASASCGDRLIASDRITDGELLGW